MKSFKNIIFLIIFSCLPFIGLTQNHKLRGRIIDNNNSPVFAANIYLSDLRHVAISGLDGSFELLVDHVFHEDTLIISFVGYKGKKIKLEEIDLSKFHEFVLYEDFTQLEAIVVAGRNPISESFAITKLERLEIYGIPIAAGDPLKAVTSLAASTNTDETANPSLRGSPADRSVVTLNRVPVLNPVRNSQLSGLGNFSLFNTEIISELYVYASNPPLTFGNSTGGMVEIETINEVASDQTQLSAGLANLGLFITRKLNQNSFIQAYSNYQFHDLFTELNKRSMEKLNGFGSIDFGCNIKIRINDRLSLNSFTYGINEFYNMETEQFSFVDNSIADNKRGFTINNLTLTTPKGILSINSGYDIGNSNFKYGIIKSNMRSRISYSSIDYKSFPRSNLVLQFGTSFTYSKFSLRSSIPKFHFSLTPSSPHFSTDTTLKNKNLENYLFAKWKISNKLVLSAGARTNLPINDQKHYLSYQLGLRHEVGAYSSFLVSLGKYHNYSIPNYFFQRVRLLNSYHFALDYSFDKNELLINAAIYYKLDRGEVASPNVLGDGVTFNKLENFGIEFCFEKEISNSFKFSLANTFLNQKLFYDEEEFTGANSLKYFIKTALSYNNPKLFNLTLKYITRPGLFHTKIVGSDYIPEYDLYMPIYGIFNNEQFRPYNNLSLSINRYFTINKSAVIAFASISNILNSNNERSVIYSNDFSYNKYDYYQRRAIYFGVVFRF